MSKLIDLSHEIADGTVTYPGFPAPKITDFLSWEESHSHYAEGVEFQVGRVDLLAATGTYLDSPAHRHQGGADIADLEISILANVSGVIIRPTQREINSSAFNGLELAGKAVLVQTGWSGHWGSDSYQATDHPFLTADAADFLVESKVAIVAIDCVNIDDNSPASKGQRPVHTALLANGIPIVENLCNLEQITDAPFSFFAVPPKLRGMGSFTVRAFVLQD
jgi:arylformamidase